MNINVAKSELKGPPRISLATLGVELFAVVSVSFGLVLLFS